MLQKCKWHLVVMSISFSAECDSDIPHDEIVWQNARIVAMGSNWTFYLFLDKLLVLLPCAATKRFTQFTQCWWCWLMQQLDVSAFSNLVILPKTPVFKAFAPCTATTEETNMNLQMLDTNVMLTGDTLFQRHLVIRSRVDWLVDWLSEPS